jgi:hypothetical protein
VTRRLRAGTRRASQGKAWYFRPYSGSFSPWYSLCAPQFPGRCLFASHVWLWRTGTRHLPGVLAVLPHMPHWNCVAPSLKSDRLSSRCDLRHISGWCSRCHAGSRGTGNGPRGLSRGQEAHGRLMRAGGCARPPAGMPGRQVRCMRDAFPTGTGNGSPRFAGTSGGSGELRREMAFCGQWLTQPGTCAWAVR